MPPRWIFSLMNPVAKFLLAAGIPLGPNGRVTVLGRTSRTVGLAKKSTRCVWSSSIAVTFAGSGSAP